MTDFIGFKIIKNIVYQKHLLIIVLLKLYYLAEWILKTIYFQISSSILKLQN